MSSGNTANDTQDLQLRIQDANKLLKDCDGRIKKQRRKNLKLGREIKNYKWSIDYLRRQETDTRVELEVYVDYVDTVPRCKRTAAIYQACLNQMFAVQDAAAMILQKLADLRQQTIVHGRATDDLAEERSKLKAELRALQKAMTEKHAPNAS